jgi:hypothetical protein
MRDGIREVMEINVWSWACAAAGVMAGLVPATHDY